MKESALAIAAFSALVGVSQAATAQEWALRSIYQVMTDRFARTDGSTTAECNLLKYCGGTWTGLINRLDYIQDMGFTAIQISPVVENIPDDTGYGEAYHGYWPRNNYALNANFGDAGDLSHLVDEVHGRGMYLMVDVVINDMAQAIDGDMPQPINYSAFNPFNDEKYFHPYCNITNYDDSANAQGCWLGATNVALPDLDTDSQEVVTMTGNWIRQLVSNYSIDGLRIDAAKHVNDGFLPPFLEAAGVFTFGEVYTGQTEDLCRYQRMGLLAGLPNYLQYFPLIRAFTEGKMYDLAMQISATELSCNNTAVLGTFVENHDLPRFASIVNDTALAANAIAFVVLSDGIPTIYQGQEQHFNGNYSPYNRENLWKSGYDTSAPLYNITRTLNRLRNHAIDIDSHYVTNHSSQLYIDGSTYCTRKGPDGAQIVACFSNQGRGGGAYQLVVPGGFDEGTEVVEVFSCNRTRATAGGNITAFMGQGKPLAWFPTASMNGSGLCDFDADRQNGTGNATSSPDGSASATSSGVGSERTNGAVETGSKIGSAILGAAVAMALWTL